MCISIQRNMLHVTRSAWICLFVYVCGGWLPGGWAEKILGHETDEFDFDGLPGAQHEFKVEVGAGQEECFYQKVVAGGKMHISFEVLRGGNMDAQMGLRKPVTGHMIQQTKIDIRGGFQYQCEETGAYAICLDNTFSRMSSKLVYVYIVTYVESEWEQYRKEIEEVSLTVHNFTASVQQVQNSLNDARNHQAQSRMHVIKDWYLISGNNQYIQRWSLAQCCVIIVSTCIQVYFLRRLFRTTNVTPTSKPRA